MLLSENWHIFSPIKQAFTHQTSKQAKKAPKCLALSVCVSGSWTGYNHENSFIEPISHLSLGHGAYDFSQKISWLDDQSGDTGDFSNVWNVGKWIKCSSITPEDQRIWIRSHTSSINTHEKVFWWTKIMTRWWTFSTKKLQIFSMTLRKGHYLLELYFDENSSHSDWFSILRSGCHSNSLIEASSVLQSGRALTHLAG